MNEQEFVAEITPRLVEIKKWHETHAVEYATRNGLRVDGLRVEFILSIKAAQFLITKYGV